MQKNNQIAGRIFGFFFITVFLISLPSEGQQKPDPKNNVGVNALLERFEYGYKTKKLDAVLACFSGDAVLVESPGMNLGLDSQVVSGDALRTALELSLASPLTKFAEISIIDGTGNFTLKMDDSIGDMILTNALYVKNVGGTPARVGFMQKRFIAVKYEEGVWRLAFIFPSFVDSRVVVENALAGSQAEYLGIETGDIITHHMLMPIIDSDQLLWRAKMFYRDPPERKFRVLVRRENRLLPLYFGPGKMGIKTRNIFEGHVDTITLTGRAAEEHPAASVVKEYNTALKKADLGGILAAFDPRGFIFCHGLPGLRIKGIITVENASREIAWELDLLKGQGDLNELETSDLRFIMHGKLALAGWRVSWDADNGAQASHNVVVCLSEFSGAWRIAGMPWQNGHVLELGGEKE